VLEVIGLGVTLDKYRQSALWDVLSKGNAHASIREQDPKKYPWSEDDKDGQEGGRANDSMENGAKFSPIYWGIPAFLAGSPSGKELVTPTSPTATIASLDFHLFVAAGWDLSERPDQLIERVFKFFDENPDVPFVVVSSVDGLYNRNLYRPKGTPPLVRNGYYVPEMPDSSAVFVLARRERAEAVRGYAFEDFDEGREGIDMKALNAQGFGRRLYLSYLRLSKEVPKNEGIPRRTPTVAEWLQETAAFAKRPEIYSKVHSAFDQRADKRPSKDFRPTPWFPIPWNKDQWEDFDKLPTYGFIHRPVFVKTVDENGKPLSRQDARAAALAVGWDEALHTLPEKERIAAPARVITATGGNLDQLVAISSVFNGWATKGGPELDKSKATQWIDTDARLGNTGAATWFMQMAIGLMGSYREGGASAAINLRDPSEASIIFVTPPSEEKRKTQHHPKGGDVLRHLSSPAIDPANYK
jgi:hypothetical protein